PLLRRRVVEPERNALDVQRTAADIELDEVCAPVRDAAHDRRAVELDPFLRAGQRLLQEFHVGLPGADLEVEIVLAVARRRGKGRPYENAEDATQEMNAHGPASPGAADRGKRHANAGDLAG